MGSFDDFARKMRKQAKDVPRNADQLVRKVGLATDATVVLGTPVDTGRARGNWQVEVNTIPAGTVETLDKSGQLAIEQGKAKIAQYKGGTPAACLTITNNLPYIGRLNNGHSAQAPAGYVEKAISVGLNAIQGATILRSSS